MKVDVEVKAGDDLIIADRSTSDPYVKVFVYDGNGKEILRKETAVVKKTLAPTWNWRDTVETEGVSRLRFEVWDHDTFTKDDFMGILEVHGDDLKENNQKNVTRKLVPFPPGTGGGGDARKAWEERGEARGLGTITVFWNIPGLTPDPPRQAQPPPPVETDTQSATFNPGLPSGSSSTASKQHLSPAAHSPRAASSAASLGPKQLIIRPLVVTGLPIDYHKRGKLSVTCEQKGRRVLTKTLEGDTNPRGDISWTSSAQFDIKREDVNVTFEIIDVTSDGDDDEQCSGTLAIKYDDLKGMQEGTFMKIPMDILVDDDDEESGGAEEAKAYLNVEATWGVMGNGASPTMSRAETIRSRKSKESSPKLPQARIPETIELTILKAANLVKMDMGFLGSGKSDPYVKMTVDHAKMPKEYRTETIKKTLDPVWDEEFEVDIDKDANTWAVHLNVYDWDFGTQDDWMGYTVLHLTRDHLLKSIDSACEWTLDLMARPEEQYQAEDNKLIEKHAGSLGSITIGLRSQDPPYPEMTRVKTDSGTCGFVKQYEGTSTIDGDQVQMYLVAMDEGTDERHPRTMLELLGDVDDDSKAVDDFVERLDRQNEAFKALMKKRTNDFFADNELYFDRHKHPTLTREEKALQKHYVSYSDTTMHLDSKFDVRLNKHTLGFIDKFAECGTPKERMKIVEAEKTARAELLSSWEKERNKLRDETSLSVVQVTSVKLVLSSLRKVENEAQAVYMLVQHGGLPDRSTHIVKLVRSTGSTGSSADFVSGKQKSTHFGNIEPGEDGTLVNLVLKNAGDAPIGSQPTEEMTQIGETLGKVQVEVPVNHVTKNKDVKTLTQDLGWLRLKQEDGETSEAAVRVKLIMELTGGERLDLEDKAAAIQEELAKQEAEIEQKRQEEEAREIPSLLDVEVMQGNNLIIQDIFSSDPYCIVEVLGGWSDAPVSYCKETNYIDSTLAPKWNEKFTFDIFSILEPKSETPEEQRIKLRFTVWDKDTNGDDFMGYAEVVLEKEMMKKMITARKTFVLPLEKRPSADPSTIEADNKLWAKKNRYFGEIKVATRTSQPKQFGSKTEQNVLAIVAEEGHHQPGKKLVEYTFDAVPGCLTVASFGQEARIETLAENSTAAKAGLSSGLTVVSFNGTPIAGNNKALDKLIADRKTIALTVEYEGTKDCTFKMDDAKDVDFIKENEKIIVLSVRQTSDAEENGLKEGMVAIAANSKPILTVANLLSLLKNETTLTVFDAGDEGRITNSDIKLNMFVRIVKAKGLIRADSMIMRKSDPYVTACAVDSDGTPLVGRRSKAGLPLKTPIKSNTLTPSWDFAFPSAVVLNEGEKIRLDMWDDDTFGKDDFMGRAVLDPWDDAGREDGMSTEVWLTLKHRGLREDTIAAKHTTGEKPLGEVLVRFKASLVVAEDLGFARSGSSLSMLSQASMTLDQHGKAYQKVRHRESVTVTLTEARGLDSSITSSKVYGIVKLQAPPAAGGRHREYTTAVASRGNETLTWDEENAVLQFDDCSEEQVDSFTVQLMSKSFFGSDDFIGRVTVSSSDEVWQEDVQKSDWFQLQPRTKKEKDKLKKPIGEIKMLWSFTRGEEELVKKFEGKTFATVNEAAAMQNMQEQREEQRLTIYERMRGEGYTLSVDVLSCEGLSKKGKTTVEVSCGGTTEKTDPSPRSDCPEWDAACFFFNLECRNDGLNIVVKSDDRAVGKCTYFPHEHHFIEAIKCIPVIDEQGGSAGVINISYTYDHPKGLAGFLPEFKGDAMPPEPPKQQKFMLSGLLDQDSTVDFTVVQASNLPGVDSGTLQSKVVLEYMRTDIVVAEAESARYPVFNKRQKLPLQAKGGTTQETMGPQGEVLFKVYDANSILSDVLVGTAAVDFVANYHDNITAEEAVFSVSQELIATGLGEVDTFRFSGRMLTHIDGKPIKSAEQFKSCTYPAEFTFERQQWLDLKPRLDEAKRPNPDDAKLLKKYGNLGKLLVRWSHNMNIEKTHIEEKDEDEGEPMLVLTIFEGENLIACDMITSDPYVLVKCGEEMQKTSYKKSTLSPFWGEELPEIPIVHAANQVELTCMDLDINDDDFMGCYQFDPFAWVFGDADSVTTARSKEGWVDLVPRELNKEDQKLYEKNNSSFGRLRIKVALKGDLTKVEGAKFDLSKSFALNREAKDVPLDQLKREGGKVSIWIDSASSLQNESLACCKLLMGGKEFVTPPPGTKTISPSWLAGPFSVKFSKATDATKESSYGMVFTVLDGTKEFGTFTFNALEIDKAVGSKEVSLRVDDDDKDSAKPHGKLNFRWEIDFGIKDMVPWSDPEVRSNLKQWLAESDSKLRLSFTLIRCTNLLDVETFGQSDPYVIISCGAKQTQTKVVSNNCNPIYNHDAQWDIDTFEQPIEFKIKDKELLGNDNELGMCRLNLATISDEKGEETIAVQPSPGMTETKLGHLVVKYAIEKVQKQSAAVRLTVVEGKDLADPNMLFKVSPKVVVHVGEGSGRREMEGKPAKGTAPTWVENFDFALNSKERVPISISIWEGDTCIGVHKRECDFMGGEHEGDEWVTLQPRSENPDDALLESKYGTLGQIHFTWEVDTPQAREEREMKREMRLRQLYEANVLNFRVMRARNLPNWMMMSPQCRVMFPTTCDEQDVCKTTTQSGQNPVWGLECSWKLSNLLLNQEVQLQVWDINVMKDKWVGTAQVNVWDNASDSKGERWLKLDDNGGEVLVNWNLANEFAPSRIVLQVWLDKVLDVVIPVDEKAKSSSDTSSLYTVLDLGPYNRQTECVEAQKGTERLGAQTCSVSWGQVFEFDPVPVTHQFVFHVWNKHTMGADVCLGKVVWDWGAVTDISDGSKQLPITAVDEAQEALAKKMAGLGQLSVKWKTVSRQLSGIRDGQKVKCTVMKTRGLPQIDNPMRVYTVVTFGGAKEMSDATTTNELNYCSEFRAANDGQEIRVEIWEKNYGLASDTHIGYTSIPYGHDEEASGEEWLRLRPRNGIEADYVLSADNNGSLGEALVQWEWDTELFSGAGKKHKKQKRQDLEIKILNAQNLTPQDTNGLSDPYVIVKHSGTEFKTQTKENSLSPYWNETFTFTDCNVKWPIIFTTMDYDFESPDDFMGQCKLSIPKGKEEGTTTLPLVIRTGCKEDVVLQEKYGGKLGTLSVEWRVFDVEEEEAEAPKGDPVGIATVSVLSAKVHAANKTCTVRVTLGDMSRETMRQQGQDLTWDKEGIREQWKLPLMEGDEGLRVEIIDNKSKSALAARVLLLQDIAHSEELRQQLPLFKLKDGEIVDGFASGDIVDLEAHLSSLDQDKGDLVMNAGYERWCKKCKMPMSGEDVMCAACGQPTIELNDTKWMETATEWGGLSIGGVTPSDHTAGAVGPASVKVGSKLFTFGGKTKSGYSAVMRQYDNQLSRWSVLESKCPHERYGATMVHHQNKLLVYGGFGPGGLDAGLTAMGGTVETDSHFIEVSTDGDYWDDPKVALGDTPKGPPGGYFDSVVEYDLSAGTWRKLPAHGPGWDFRACHSSVVYKSKMIVYGGWSIFIKQAVYDTSRTSRLRKPNIKYSTIECRRGDVASYNITTGKWSWVKAVYGDAPLPRSHHTAVLKPSSCFMFVFGGVTVHPDHSTDAGDMTSTQERQHYLDDLHVLDLRNKVWSTPRTNGDIPEPRAEHAATVSGPSMIIMGGRNSERVFGEDSCYQFSFGSAVWQKISMKSSISRTLTSENKSTETKKGRWGMCIAAFKPRVSQASSGDLTDKQKTLQERKDAQKERSTQLLKLLGDEASSLQQPVVPVKDVQFNLLVVGGCEKKQATMELQTTTGNTLVHDTTQPTDTLPSRIGDTIDSGFAVGHQVRCTVQPPSAAPDSVLANMTAPVAFGAKRLHAPRVGTCSNAVMWHMVSSSYSAAVAGGDEEAVGRSGVSAVNQSTLQALLEASWVDPGVSSAGPKQFIRGAGGGPARKIQTLSPTPPVKQPLKVKDEDMEKILGRLKLKTYRPAGVRGPPKKKEEVLPPTVKRSEESILRTTEMQSKGISLNKKMGQRKKIGAVAVPGQVVKLRAPRELQGKQLISGAAGVVQEEETLRKGFLFVKFNGLDRPTHIAAEDIVVPGSDTQKRKKSKKKTPRAPSHTTVELASSSPPRAYLFPDQWLEDEEAASSDN